MKKRNMFAFLFAFGFSSFLYSQSWRPLSGNGLGDVNGDVLSLYHDTAYLWIGGHFTQASGFPASNVVRHNGTNYVPTPGVSGDCWRFMKFKGKVYACGRFAAGGISYGLMRFDDTAWVPLMRLTDGGSVYAAAVYQNKLVVGGDFAAIAGISSGRLLQFDGTSWSALIFAGQLSGGSVAIRSCMVDSGKLYVVGDFWDTNLSLTTSGWMAGNCLVYNGNTWSSLPLDINNSNQVRSIFKHQNALWTAGYFDGCLCCPYQNSASSGSCNGIVNGPKSGWTHWNCVGGGIPIAVWAGASFGGNVYAGGTTGGTFYPYAVSRLWKWNGIAWSPDSAFNQQGVSWTVSVRAMEKNPSGTLLYVGGQFAVNGATNIAVLPLGGALPVSLTSFSGFCNHGEAMLSWQTASEINNDHFDVEYSSDGIAFATLARVEGKGTINEVSSYEWSGPSSSLGYYRLKQVDADGGFSESRIVSIDGCTEDMPVRLSSSPGSGSMQYSGVPLNAKCSLYNILGQKMRAWTAEGHNGVFDVSDIPYGSYVFVAESEAGSPWTVRFVK